MWSESPKIMYELRRGRSAQTRKVSTGALVARNKGMQGRRPIQWDNVHFHFLDYSAVLSELSLEVDG